ncbi:hypothetical protein BH10PSE12_BH10PSE12_02750 [soil metagenome]
MLFQLSPIAIADGYGEAILSLADAKTHLRLEPAETDEDDLVAAFRDASIDMVEQYAGVRLLATEGIIATFAGFGPRMRVGIGPPATVEITGVTYRDDVGAEVPMPSGWRTGMGGSIEPESGAFWPAGAGQVTVTFTAGFPEGGCPSSLIAAVKLMLGHLYVNREAIVTGMTVSELPLGVMTLCNPYRQVSI